MEKEKLEKWRKLEEEARRIREENADWKFIEEQPPRVRAALKFYVKTGDIRLACKIAGLEIAVFRELLRKASIPVVV